MAEQSGKSGPGLWPPPWLWLPHPFKVKQIRGLWALLPTQTLT